MSHMPRDHIGASRVSELITLVLGLALLIVIFSELPSEVFSPESQSFFFVIGGIAIWRYSWWLVQAVRSTWYNRRIFPRLRAAADAADEVVRAPELFVLCTSYRIEAEINFQVYDAMVREVAEYGVPTTIFASISDRTDVDVITHVMDEHCWPENIEIRYMFQKGDGKRSAMAEVLRAISRRLPAPGSLLISMDGDIRLEPGTLRRSLSFFQSQEDLGALTTNNRAEVTGNDATREWYDLRYAQRHLMMSSMSVSRRLLVLTGRYSVFRADLATQPGFIELIESDHVDHWRFGNFKFLSGDDKSSWYWLLKHGWRMMYLPDVYVTGFEELPDRRRFFASTTDLMRRWYGNMLRTSNRAIALGPRPMGMFTWWSLVDQRISMWTTLVGPTVVTLVTLFVRPSFFFAYILWILFTRGIATMILAWQRGRFSLLWIPLIYYNQVWGAMLKTYVSFRFNRQKWSRQGISAGEPGDPVAVRRQRRMGNVLHGFTYGLLLFALMLTTGVVQPLDRTTLSILRDQGWQRSQQPERVDRWLSASIADAPEGGTVQLPAGRYHLDGTLFDSLHEETRVMAGQISGVDGSTTLALSPDLADHMQGPGGEPLNGSVHCTLESSCYLTLNEKSLTLVNIHLMVEPSVMTELAAAEPSSKEQSKDG
ncbi:glycosyltransferase family 2 protein [Halomonas sp. M5N1S17]|uniref:glycosyltransferase n=1 Tax=Halomonas alkalisoli TaxID=2907158 RepID=UPI001F1B4833|nr:glycosyltransferase [Halomonas alkalisoli]MCE9662635.1 glycosyltransferase family 2 protein [Halomonas alkalisoli]